jgi:hypothetical protein
VDEVIILKSFDSASLTGGVAPGVPHGSPELENEGALHASEARRSIDVRLIAIW